MARFNEILVGRYNRFIQKLLSMKGDASLFQFSTEMGGYLPFFSGVENRALESWDRFGDGIIVAGVAAVNSRIRFRNPAGSNVVAVLEQLSATTAATDSISLHNTIDVSVADLAVLDSPAQLDKRTRPNSSTVASHGTSAANMPTARAIGVKAALANTNLEWVSFEDQEITILPGMAVEMFANTVNNQLTASYMFRERFLEDSERL